MTVVYELGLAELLRNGSRFMFVRDRRCLSIRRCQQYVLERKKDRQTELSHREVADIPLKLPLIQAYLKFVINS